MFPAILLITCLELISACLVESLSSSNYANLAILSSESFSLRSQIELHDDGILKASVRTWEQYSRLEQRAVIELEQQDPIEQIGTSGRVIYYHDAKSMIWLRWAKTKCLGSSRIELEREIYGKEMPASMGSLFSDSTDFRHIIGAAQLLLGINEVCKSSFVKTDGGRGGSSGEPRMIRGFETSTYGCELEGGVKLEILYAPFGGSVNKPDGLPISLKFALTTSQTLVINYYHIKKLEFVPTPSLAQTTSQSTTTATTNEQISLNLLGEGSFLFPLGLGCGRVLREMTGQHDDPAADERDQMQKSIQSVSFRARYSSSGSAAGTGNGKSKGFQQHQEENLLVSFNMRAKLMRREKTISLDESMEQHKGAKSVTIYDFGPRRTKYNLVSTFSSKARDYNYSLSNIVDEGSEVTDCVAMPLEKISNNSREEFELEFVKFERLQFMGLAQVDGVEVAVFEDDHLNRLPFWLDPSVSLEDGNQQHSARSLEPRDVALIYYFAANDDENNDRGRWFDNLLRIDIITRDPKRNSSLLMIKEVRIFNFIWNQLISSPLGVRNLDLFSLNSNCLSYRKSLRSAHFAMYLESTASSSILEEDNSIDIHDWNRNEAILRALATNFHLPQTHIDHIESSIVQTVDQNIRLEFRVNDFENLKQIQCHELGRGQFLSQDRLMQNNAFTFEDCLWFANYCSDRIKDEIVFAHDEVRSLCLVDKLYRWRDLQYHEARLADTSRLKSLNYFPYEYGNHVMYEISYPASTSNNDFSENLKTFNHIVGQQLSLILDDTNSKSYPRQLNYTIEQVKVIHDRHVIGDKQLGARFKNLGWYYRAESPSDQGPGLKFLKRVELTRSLSPYSDHENPQAIATSGTWTEALCQYYCLVDTECKSYSYCERASSGRTECVLSKLDVGQPEVMEQLSSIQTQLKARILRGNNKIKRIVMPSAATMIAATVTMEHIFVQIDRRCSIQAKMYGKLFDKGHQTTKIDLAKQPEVLSVAGQDECAAKCFARNLDYFKGLLRHKLDLVRVHEELTQVIKNSHQHSSELASSFDDKLDSATNWHHGHLKNICSHFMYVDNINNNSTKNPCILSGSGDRTHNIRILPANDGDGGYKGNHSTIAMNVHRMTFGHLYERMHGFRLSEAAAVQSPQVMARDDDASILANYTRRLEFYQAGRNTQVPLATDSIEHCARVCTLQTHGPRPACSSFDYVQERGRSNSTGRKYCLLNSQSLHDLRRADTEEQQVVYSDHLDRVQFWHYEPRDSLLMPTNNQDGDDDNDNDYPLISKMIARLDRSITKQTTDKREAFRGISLAIALFGILSGLFLGIKLIEFSESMYNMDEMKFKNSVIRTIHRLSGVSLGLGVRDSEVLM